MKIKAFSLIIILCLGTFLSCTDDDNDDLSGITSSEEIPSEPTSNEPSTTGQRVVCENGFATIYTCQNYDLMARITIDELEATGNNDIWGWTSPSNSREYALVGTRQSTVFVDVTDAENPVIVGRLLTETSESPWRDIKVYNNYAFIVSEADNHGMQIFDLNRLSNLDGSTVEDFEEDALYTGFGNAHNIVVNEETGYAYAVGTSTFEGGPHFVNIQDPLNPIAAGGYAMSDYTHDAQVVIYNGPDTEYQGREIFIGSNENEVVVVDVTDKENPTFISNTVYPNIGYTHQGWLSEDQTVFYANDETDERDFGLDARTLIFDFTDLDNPFYIGPFFGVNQAIDHNLYVNGDELFLSNYTAGMRVADISNKTVPVDIGFFDTFPANDNTSFDGVWSIYPYFPSGNIIINDIDGGLFIVRRSGT